MINIPYIQLRNSGYYYRQAVPHVIQHILDKCEIVVSLKTKSAVVARERAIPLMASIYDLFNEMRNMLDKLDHPQAQKIADNWKRRVLNEDFDERLAGARARSKNIAAEVLDLRGQLKRMDFLPHADLIDDVAAEFNLHLQPGSQSWRRLGYQMLKAMKDSLEEIDRRDSEPEHEFDYIPIPEDEITPSDFEDFRLSVVLKKWEERSDRPSKTLLDWRKAVQRFIELQGDKDVRQIKKTDIRAYIEACRMIPCHVSGEDRSLSAPELIRKYVNASHRRLSPSSINKCLTAVRSVMSFALSMGYIDSNPCDGVSVPKRKSQTARRMPFSHEDLRAVFVDSPVAQGKIRYRGDAGYWIPLLALFTGARMEELGQLLVADVKQEADTWFLDINASGDDKSLKTANSERRVPIHAELVRLGFLRYVAKMQKERRKHLFPRLPHDREKCTPPFSKWFNRYLRVECGITDKRKVFHSFRHTFKDACRSAGIPVDIHDALTGHTDSSISSSYGLGHALPKLQEAMERIEYPGLKLVPLRTGR